MAHELPTTLLRSCDEGTFTCIAQWAYRVTEGTFWTFLLFGFCISLFMATSRLGNARAFGFASFTGMIGSIWFATIGIMSWWIATIFILGGALGIVMMIMNKR